MPSKDFTELKQKIEKEYRNITGIHIVKGGELLHESYYNGCHEQSRVNIYSVTKSIISLLLGIAMDKNMIESVDQKILDFFPEYPPEQLKSDLKNLTIKNLITMTTPFKYGALPPYIKYFTSDDWVRFSMDQIGGKKNIGDFNYTPLIGPDILSGILSKATGKSVSAFANECLFEPLGISQKEDLYLKDKNDYMKFNKSTDLNNWTTGENGINPAGWGLTLSAGEMSSIGQLCLNEGMWGDEAIVSKEWISESVKEHSQWKKLNLSYGYLWWVLDEGKGIYAAMGDGGNAIYINKSRSTVISIQSSFMRNAKDRIKLIEEEILPLID